MTRYDGAPKGFAGRQLLRVQCTKNGPRPTVHGIAGHGPCAGSWELGAGSWELGAGIAGHGITAHGPKITLKIKPLNILD